MPVSVMMAELDEKLLLQFETQELEAPGGIATPQVYSQLLVLYLMHNDMNNARYLWKRIPQAIKTANPELAAIWAVGQRIWQRDFPGIYTAIAAYQWSESILPVMEALRATTDMEIQRTASLLGSPGSMESLEKQLSCPICLDMFTKPVVILPCQHNLCRGCASDLYDSRNPYRFSGGVFRCPTCRFEVVLDRHGVHGLQRNLLVENIIDIYKQQQEGGSGGSTTETSIKPKSSKEPMCQEHEDEKINIYCVTHQTPTCSMCKVFGQHKDCEVSPLASVYQAQKGELSNAIDALVAGNGRLQALLNQMEEACTAVQDNAQSAKQRLGECFDSLYAALEERKNALLERIGKEQDEKVAALRSLARRYGDRLQAATELTDTAVQALEQSGAAEFLQASKNLIAQTKDAAKSSLAEERPEPGFERMDHFTLDTEHVESLLSKMDFGADDEEEFEDAEDQEEE
ncbi:COP9 signalosome complex subunit 8 isoform X2 [Megalobrama amblycephala]|uniref:COP9 signalosome complex subunit 8 isoform X2 n=1 Tax=Megalobrama amblycephala TaxID=75352 RepID=UPI002013EF02|nr:COP9 signalosome complex subunit 8 isoform X2 [Megalobrama amblycephala]